MTILRVGSGQSYSTIATAVAASASGDTVVVQSGTYTNDFLTISHDLTIQGEGGPVNLVATAQPPNGKAIIDEGGRGVSVTLSGLTLSGATVPDGNGAGIRYEGGSLILNGMTITGNQEGLLGAADANGSITINASTFSRNGAGDGYTHDLYVGAIASLVVQGSSFSSTSVGHDIKSRAASNTIRGNFITDSDGTASYEIDLPNGGVADISGNVIEKGSNAQNPVGISYGEEGLTGLANSLSVNGNLIVNDFAGHSTTAIRNSAPGVTATVSGNTFYGWTNQAAGAATVSGNVVAGSRPALTLPGGTPPASSDPLVDTAYIYALRPDVATAGVDVVAWYNTFGWREGTNPDRYFDAKYYLTQNPDVRASGMSPLQHYEQYGWAEGRDPSLLFSTRGYVAAHPSSASPSSNPLLQFLTTGAAQGLSAVLAGGTAAIDILVDPAFYDPQLGATLLPTGDAARQQAAYSYSTTGWQGGLNPTTYFNTAYYLAANPDVAAAHVNPLLHYEAYGWHELRNPSAQFSTVKYLIANPDVAVAGVDPLVHYVGFGQAEGRAIYPA